ncbi:MAG: argininosuccinate lyase [Clostridia bacterium]|nr:argininosuccinate lyase [Clostridia bacterium]
MKLWGGRFNKETDKAVDDFNSSISFDCKMYKEDIEGSIAHVTMLGKQGIIPAENAETIKAELGNILKDIEDDKIEFSLEAEDIHMNIESILIERLEGIGKQLHTGRSRNDQVALDVKMYTRNAINDIKGEVKNLLSTIASLAEQEKLTVMPGYTHLQKAQPITLGHHLMAYFQMFKRDYERLCDCLGRMSLCPLGSGALATTTYPLDRHLTAKLLGFEGPTENSLDGVSDRDHVAEFIFDLSMIMMHLSRFSEEIILWCSDEFSFIRLDDAYSTGSSIMPQKKNPDIAELTRGKTGRVYGSLITILTILKGIPLAYNKDMQEDKETLFDAYETVKMCLPIFAKMIETMTVNTEKMRNGAKGGFTNATDAADYLVKKGMPFRDAHRVIGEMVSYSIGEKISLEEIPLSKLKEFSELIEEDYYQAIALETCVNERNVYGGPSPDALGTAIDNAKRFLESL